MAWICPSCGLENSDDSQRTCACGRGLNELSNNSLQELSVKKTGDKKFVSKKIHVLLFIIGFIGLVAGYILVPIFAALVDIIMVLGIFVPIEDKNK
ncbi:MAG: hypothetical protein AB1724_02920 [Thermodesulfobacteriota bacterium]